MNVSGYSFFPACVTPFALLASRRRLLSLATVVMLVMAAVSCALLASPLAAAEFDAGDLEFFEKHVRPLLAEHCYACHSAKSKELKGGLRVDSRNGLIRGGDTGPAIVPGNRKDSLLVDAVRYGDIYQMPPKYQLPKDQVAILEKWVERGAAWPEEVEEEIDHDRFDLDSRRKSHWAWQPIRGTKPPAVGNESWPHDPLDHFILAKLEANAMAPAADATPAQRLRRVYYDLIGLPPSANDVTQFLQEVGKAGERQALAARIDALLESPQFGERWGRHWLDLMRYADSRGHEFDFNTANAWQFRDYVIRAFNANVPYDQLLREHLAGDLLANPRRHPEKDFNESVLGTGFWFLGEWVHSPVDIRKDEMDRMDNALDVFSKTFLGMTVACARCHDHKFDAISQTDYYAMLGFLQSSAYRQVRFESIDHNRSVAKQMAAAQAKHQPLLTQAAWAAACKDAPSPKLLQAAVEAVREGAQFRGSEQPPLVFADFETGNYDGWEVTGNAFGAKPVTGSDTASYQGEINAVGKFFVNSHNKRPSAGKQNGDAATGSMTSIEFTIGHSTIEFWIGGGSHRDQTQLQLLVGGKAVRKSTGRNNNQMHLGRWDVSELRGKTARIQVIDNAKGGWGNIGFDHVVFRNSTERPSVSRATEKDQAMMKRLADKHRVDSESLARWTVALLRSASGTGETMALRPLGLLGSNDLAAAKKWAADHRDLTIPKSASVVSDFRNQAEEGADYWTDGAAFQSVAAGEIQWSSTPEGPVVRRVEPLGHVRLHPAFSLLKLNTGSEREPGALGRWDRAGKTLRTGSFELTSSRVHYLVRGGCQVQAVVDSHRTILGPLHGSLVKAYAAPASGSDQWRWVTHALPDYKGHRLHIEFSQHKQDPLAIAMVVVGDNTPPALSGLAPIARAVEACETEEALFETFANQMRVACEGAKAEEAWRGAALACVQFTGKPRLEIEAYLAKQDELAASLRFDSHLAPAIWDGSAEDEFLLIRGNASTPSEQVPRRALEAFGAEPIKTPGSGRLELAEQLLADENPLVARVFVNRVWHHLFGRGIVPSVDNFGVLGETPTHPELLDHLAIRFRKSGWNIKQLIREIMLSRTYSMSSAVDTKYTEQDPNNLLLHHVPLRRLQGEAIRDGMLQLSGRLDLRPFGPSVPVHLTAFMQGRGRPGQGPLDGAGRRSIYISVRRNFLSPMMLAFDTPQPTTAIGRRTTSNVPAQALILLNDPFVMQQAQGWAKRLSALPHLEDRIRQAYMEGLNRPARDSETLAIKAFLKRQAESRGVPGDLLNEQVWADLCHAIFNLKEFIYLP